MIPNAGGVADERSGSIGGDRSSSHTAGRNRRSIASDRFGKLTLANRNGRRMLAVAVWI
jgi:hypothetical protein